MLLLLTTNPLAGFHSTVTAFVHFWWWSELKASLHPALCICVCVCMFVCRSSTSSFQLGKRLIAGQRVAAVSQTPQSYYYYLKYHNEGEEIWQIQGCHDHCYSCIYSIQTKAFSPSPHHHPPQCSRNVCHYYQRAQRESSLHSDVHTETEIWKMWAHLWKQKASPSTHHQPLLHVGLSINQSISQSSSCHTTTDRCCCYFIFLFLFPFLFFLPVDVNFSSV